MSPTSNKIALSSMAPTSTQPPRRSASTSITSAFSRNSRVAEHCYARSITRNYRGSGIFPILPLIDWLDYNGYTVVTKATKDIHRRQRPPQGQTHMDIELAVDAMELRRARRSDRAVLGDGDFPLPGRGGAARGVRFTVVSRLRASPPMIATSCASGRRLHRSVGCNPKLGRDPSERRPGEPRHHAPQFLQRATTTVPRGDDDDSTIENDPARGQPPTLLRNRTRPQLPALSKARQLPRGGASTPTEWFNFRCLLGDPDGRLLIVVCAGAAGRQSHGGPFTGISPATALRDAAEYVLPRQYQARPDDGLR